MSVVGGKADIRLGIVHCLFRQACSTHAVKVPGLCLVAITLPIRHTRKRAGRINRKQAPHGGVRLIRLAVECQGGGQCTPSGGRVLIALCCPPTGDDSLFVAF